LPAGGSEVHAVPRTMSCTASIFSACCERVATAEIPA
jgi:hypothetical protein